MSAAPEQGFQPPPPPTPQTQPSAPRPARLLQVGIGLIVLGVVVIVGGLLGFIPGSTGTGVAIAFLGIVLLGLSFIPLPVVVEEDPPLSLFDKVTGIFYEPSRVFRNLRAYPHWAGAFVLIGLLTVTYSASFVKRVTPERIVEHTTQKLADMGPPFAPRPDALERLKTQQVQSLKNPVERVGTALKTFVGVFVTTAAVAAISLLGILVLGGRINFWQALAVTFYASLPVVAIQKILGLVILYLKPPDDLHPILNQQTTLQDNLGILFSPGEQPVLFVLASFIGITSFYGLWLRAKGLHLGATRVGSGPAWGVAITLWVLMLLFLTVLTVLFPGFIA